jgi:hypothetical protein
MWNLTLQENDVLTVLSKGDSPTRSPVHDAYVESGVLLTESET